MRRTTFALLVFALLCLPALGTGQARVDLGPWPCTFHHELQRVAEDLLQAAEPPTAERLTAQLAKGSVRVPGVRALLLPEPDAAGVEAFLGELSEANAEPQSVLCGHATGDAGELWLAAPALGSLRVADRVALVELGPGLREPYLVVMTAGPRFQVLPVETPRVPLPLDPGEPALVQLMATGDAGPRPLATVEVAGGARGLDRVHPADIEAPYHGVVGRLRKRHTILAVRRNRLLREAALRHAKDVCRVGDAVHVVAGQGPEARMREQGIEAAAVGEAVARAGSPAEAYNSLLRSPSHALTLLHRDFTDVGVATAHDGRGHTCLVVLLARYPRYSGR